MKAESKPMEMADWLAEVSRMAQLRHECESTVIRAITGARKSGCSWDEIGTALGVTRQGASQRYGFVDAK